MTKQKKTTIGLLLAVVATGALMRAPITTLPLVLKQLADSLHVSQGSLGILTTLPLVMFLIFSNFASITLARIGIKKSMGISILLLLLGSIIRAIVTMPTMLIGTILIGIGIAHLNVYMPSFIKAYFPDRIDVYTTLYSFSMNLGSGAFNLITAPVVNSFGWRSILMILAVAPALVMAIWLFASSGLQEKLKINRNKQINRSKKGQSIWANIKAWPFLITFGCQSLLNYTLAAWFPVLMAYHHLNSGSIGIIVAVYSLMGIPVYLVMPRLLIQLGRMGTSLIIFLGGLCGLIAGSMLFFQGTSSFVFWMTESVLIGLSISFFFIYATTMFGVKTNDPMTTARLSGMAQSGGYFLAALGPSAYGLAFKINPIGITQNVAYLMIIIVAVIAALLVSRTDKV